MKRLLAGTLIFGSVVLLPSAAGAATILLTFTGADGSVGFNGGAPANIDLRVDLIANTDNLLPGGGFDGADRYANLTARFSSVDLGVSNVAATELLSVDFGPFPGIAPHRARLVLGPVRNGVFGNAALSTWDRVSSVGPLLMLATSNGLALNVTLTTGDTLSIVNFDNALPFGDATFQAAVPEPAALLLVGLGLAIVAIVRARV